MVKKIKGWMDKKAWRKGLGIKGKPKPVKKKGKSVLQKRLDKAFYKK